MRKKLSFFLGMLLFLEIVSVGFAVEFPTKPIRDIVPFSPGGTMDLMARLLAKPLEKEFGTRILVEYIPGGLTKLGTMECSKAKPDGYTIMQATELAWVSSYYAKLFDEKVWEKLTPIANLATEPVGLWEVKADSPFQTLAELIKAVKEKSIRLSIGISSSGVFDVMVMSVGKAAGVTFKHVPFTGAGPAGVALLGGHIDIRFCTPAEAITMIRAGKTRGLAVQAEKNIQGYLMCPPLKSWVTM